MRRWLFADLNSTLLHIARTLERMDRDSRDLLGAVHNIQQVNREILLELRDHRTILERIDVGVHANTEGLMHVLDELRGGRGGPGTAPAV